MNEKELREFIWRTDPLDEEAITSAFQECKSYLQRYPIDYSNRPIKLRIRKTELPIERIYQGLWPDGISFRKVKHKSSTIASKALEGLDDIFDFDSLGFGKLLDEPTTPYEEKYYQFLSISGPYITWDRMSDALEVNPRPIFLKTNTHHQLHCNDGPAIKWKSGKKEYFLNGIQIEEAHFNLKSSAAILKIWNVDERRELIRKYGLEKLIHQGGVIDQKGNYQLINFGGGRIIDHKNKAYYLVMKNPSVPDTYHVEGVSSRCKTVDQALQWRKPREMANIPVSEELGEPWYQQGDVYIWPKKALILKPYPTILT